MSRRLTDDEKFLVALLTHADDALLDVPALERHTGMTFRRVGAISTQLIRTNFIRRRGDGGFELTPHGQRLAQSLIE